MKIANIQAVAMAYGVPVATKKARNVSAQNYENSANFTLNNSQLTQIRVKNHYNVSFRSNIQSKDLWKAAKDNDIRAVNMLLIDPEVDVNYVDGNFTALCFACRDRYNEIFDLLIIRPDIDINKRVCNNNTALTVASRNDNNYAIEKLIQQPNIDVNVVTGNNEPNETALSIGIKRDNVQTVRQLLSCKDLDINANNLEKGRTPLMQALDSIDKEENDAIIDLLLDSPNIDVTIKDESGDVAMHYCFYRRKNPKNLQRLEKIMQKPGADINIQGGLGKTPLMLACSANWEDAINMLLDAKDIDLTLKDYQGYSALDYARKNVTNNDLIAKMVSMAKEQFDNQLVKSSNALSPRKKVVISERKIPVDINCLSPENNIWTEKEITAHFTDLVRNKKYDEAVAMLEKTAMIDFESNDKQTVRKVAATNEPDFIEKVFDYKFHKQGKMREEYDLTRKDFIENKIPTMSYDELIQSNYMVNTKEGLAILLNKSEFNPNQVAKGKSLFEKACEVDATGGLAKEILGKYDNVDTTNVKEIKNNEIASLVKDYDNGGKYGVKLAIIKANFKNDKLKEEAAAQLKEFVLSKEFRPDIADSLGNTALHAAMSAPTDNAKGIIQKIIDKGGNVDVKNIAGQTPLMLAIKSLIVEDNIDDKQNLLANIKFLLDKGVKINEQDKHGQTAFYYACCTTTAALLSLILSYKPDVFIEDFKGNRPHINLKTPEMKEIYRRYILR